MVFSDEEKERRRKIAYKKYNDKRRKSRTKPIKRKNLTEAEKKERGKLAQQKYYNKNKKKLIEKYRVYQAEYYIKNKAKILEQTRTYYNANKRHILNQIKNKKKPIMYNRGHPIKNTEPIEVSVKQDVLLTWD
tara:strand:+ start:56 stop:454 length:399 start_codon:yes stop_codon:yes gene_type:complete